MGRLIAMILLAALALMAGCSKDSDQKSAEVNVASNVAKPLMPLEIGNYWVFQLSALDTTINMVRPAAVDTFKVVGDTLIDNEKWYFVTGLGPDRGIVCNRADGFWNLRPGTPPAMFAKYPAVVNEVFKDSIGTLELINQVASTNQEVIVPAGTYQCYKYHQTATGRDIATNYFFAPGKGLIKMEIATIKGNQPLVITELMESNVGK